MAATQESDVHAVHVGDNIDEASVRDTSMPTQPEVPLGNTSEKKKRRLLSDVWKEFHLLPLEDTNNILFCACNKCGQEYPADSKKGTGNLRRHIKSCQLKTTREMGEYMVTSDKTHCLRYGNPLFTQEQFREFLVEALILHDLPLSFVEYKGIRKIFEYLEPRVDTIRM